MKRRNAYILVGVAVAAVCAVYFAVDPAVSRFVPKCLFHELTGWQCPGCGSQRMLHALLHGDIAAAWHHNAVPFLMQLLLLRELLLLPLLAPLLWLELNRTRHPRLYMRVHSVSVALTAVSLLVAWWIFRNIFLS